MLLKSYIKSFSKEKASIALRRRVCLYRCLLFVIVFACFSVFCELSSAEEEVVLEYNEAFEVIAPPEYNDIVKASHAFHPEKLKKDWIILEKPVDIDEVLYSAQNKYYKGLAESQREKTKFTAWEINPVLHMHINAFLCTGNKKYLDEFLYWSEYLLSIRMDRKKRLNFEGKMLPQWERTSQYDIFSVSPFQRYPENEKQRTIEERGWETLNFSDINYSGLVIEPILRFIQVVQFNEVNEYLDIAMGLLSEIEKTIASHEEEWIDISEKSGYYIFPKNCPFYLDGVEMPVNEAAIFGSALVRAFLITGKTQYLSRAEKMLNRWKAFMGRDKFGYISYPYFTGLPYCSGWQKNNSPSVNTPEFKANKVHEVFHKAALTIKFLILLDQANRGVAETLLQEFFYVIKATSNKNIISNFPVSFGFGYPKNTYHVTPPTVFNGWLHLISSEESVLKRVFPHIAYAKANGNYPDCLYFQYITGLYNIEYVEKKEVVVPLFMEDSDTFSPLWVSPITGVVKIIFQHTSPKNNVLYLYDFTNSGYRIRLDVDRKTNYFISRVFLEKGEKIDLRWNKTSEHSAPSSLKENRISLFFLEPR